MTTIDDLFAQAQADVDAGLVPAGQLAVARDGDVVACRAFGDATVDTRFCIFSATKALVASAVWMLMAERCVRPQDRVIDHVPELHGDGFASVTVEQLMLHTAGFPNAPMTAAEGGDPDRRRARFATWRLEWEPGSRFEYHAESAHWVLADIVDRRSGTDFRDFVEDRICAPLGLPRVLGIRADNDADLAPLVPVSDAATTDTTLRFNDPAVRAAGNPAGGAFMTAADLARFYQALLHNPGELWDPAVLHDATTHIRCRLEDPFMGVAANRTLGLVLAGDDGLHELRYAIFGRDCSPRSFGHAGAHAQVAWADPATGISFVSLTSGVDDDQMRQGARAHRLATIASRLEL